MNRDIQILILFESLYNKNFVIDEKYQRNGYGQQLLNKIIEQSILNNSTKNYSAHY